jgi:hypothetical protein
MEGAVSLCNLSDTEGGVREKCSRAGVLDGLFHQSFYSPTNAQVIVLKSILKFTLK